MADGLGADFARPAVGGGAGGLPAVDDDGGVAALLQGGPLAGPTYMRISAAAMSCGKVKIEHCGGYEHYERVAPAGDSRSPIFRWTMRTKIAE